MDIVHYAESTEAKKLLSLYKNITFLNDRVIFVNCSKVGTNQNKLEKYILDFVDIKKKYPNIKIAFEHISESIQIDIRKNIDFICITLIQNHNFLLSDFLIFYGSYPCVKNIFYYKKFIDDNKLLPIKTFLINSLELTFKRIIDDENLNIALKEYSFDYKQKIKKFLLYIGKLNEHRIYLLSSLMKKNLLKDSYTSAWFEKEQLQLWKTERVNQKFSKKLEYLKKRSNLFPIKLNVNDTIDNLLFWTMNSNEKHHYNDCIFSIIPETHFYHDQHNLANQILISEKTYRIIAGKLPFLLLAMPKALEALRESGYKTFHPWIDETYDNIENDEDRLEAIISEIERLCKFDSKELKFWCENIKEIVDYNQKKLFNKPTKFIEIY